jgi:hypothetical protein
VFVFVLSTLIAAKAPGFWPARLVSGDGSHPYDAIYHEAAGEKQPECCVTLMKKKKKTKTTRTRTKRMNIEEDGVDGVNAVDADARGDEKGDADESGDIDHDGDDDGGGATAADDVSEEEEEKEEEDGSINETTGLGTTGKGQRRLQEEQEEEQEEEEDEEESSTTYCAPPPTNQTLPGWVPPPDKGGRHEGLITVPVYGIYLADMLMFLLLRARGAAGTSSTSRSIVYDDSTRRREGAPNDYPPADAIPGSGGENDMLERLDLRCYRWDGGWEGGRHFDAPKGVIVENVASNLDNRKPVPQRYLENEELLLGWPDGDPDAEGAEVGLCRLNQVDP